MLHGCTLLNFSHFKRGPPALSASSRLVFHHHGWEVMRGKRLVIFNSHMAVIGPPWVGCWCHLCVGPSATTPSVHGQDLSLSERGEKLPPPPRWEQPSSFRCCDECGDVLWAERIPESCTSVCVVLACCSSNPHPPQISSDATISWPFLNSNK